MCGRFTLTASPAILASLFDLPTEPPVAPRYNIAPTQPVAIVRTNAKTGQREWAHVQWGLVPSWAKDPSVGARMINARAETAAEKPSFRAAFKRRRCLVPADGFYEWKKVSNRKQPYYITVRNGAVDGERDVHPFAIAGLWEYWEGQDGSALETCTLLTTSANEAMSELHNRMPVIVAPDDFAFWLGEEAEEDEDPAYLSQLQHLLRPYPTEKMQFYPVNTYVNNARNEGPTCIEAITAN
jgi:putative SOS response-associated peptidase YedK